MRALLASPLGFLVGVSLGSLGAGGSILAVPALVHGAGQAPATATATSLVVVGTAALAGLPAHWASGRVRLLPGLLFGLVGLGGSAVGSALNRRADPDVLLLAFSAVMVVAATAMWRRHVDGCEASEPLGVEPIGSRQVATGRAGILVALGTPPTRVPLGPAAAARIVVAGTGVGLLTGAFGVGGGFVVVPALVLLLGFAMPEAVGTSLVVIALNAATALALRAGTIDVHWGEVLPFLVLAAIGSLVGRRATCRLRPAVLSRGFAVLLLVVAAVTAASSLLALS